MCDGQDLGAQTCETLGHEPGLLACNADCTYDTSGCGWWDAAWAFRMPITLERAGGNKNDGQVLIALDTFNLTQAAKLEPDCADLRFVDSDGRTVLAHWVEGGCNRAALLTQIWVQVDLLAAGTSTIWLYYGNPAAANTSLPWSQAFLVPHMADCPAGWQEQSAFVGRFPIAHTPDSTDFALGAPTHHHGQVSCADPRDSNGAVGASATPAVHAVGAHYHADFAVSIDATDVVPPHVNVAFCSTDDLIFSPDARAMFAHVGLRVNWEMDSEHFNGRFLRGYSPQAPIAQLGGRASHRHSFEGETTHPENIVSSDPVFKPDVGNDEAVSTENHTHDIVAGHTVEAANLPPFYTLRFEYPTAPEMALAAMILAVAVETDDATARHMPPLGWRWFDAPSGRLLRGAQTPGEVGGNETHRHDVEMETAPPSGSILNVSTVGSGNPFVLAGHTHECDELSEMVSTDGGSNYPELIPVYLIERRTSDAEVEIGWQQEQTVP
jgi:hypothetical protein